MKAEYDKETDTLTITLRDARVKESDEIRPGLLPIRLRWWRGWLRNSASLDSGREGGRNAVRGR